MTKYLPMMKNLQIVRRYSSKQNTWTYRQGFYQYDQSKRKDQYYPLICKFKDRLVVKETFAKEHGAEWDKNEKKWVIVKDRFQ